MEQEGGVVLNKFVCAGGCSRPVKGIYCPGCRERKEQERATAEAAAAQAAAERMKDPEVQRRLQEARDRATAERKAAGVKTRRRRSD